MNIFHARQSGMNAGRRLLDMIEQTNARIEGRPVVRREIELSESGEPLEPDDTNVIKLFPESE